jgi:hypothetical protein
VDEETTVVVRMEVAGFYLDRKNILDAVYIRKLWLKLILEKLVMLQGF